MSLRAGALILLATLFLPGAMAGTHAASTPNLQVFVEPQAHTAPVLSLIRSAHHSLRLEVYILTNRTIIGALARARRQGIDVRVMLEEHPFGGGSYARRSYAALRQAGIPVRWANEAAFTYTHEKAMEIDGQVAGIFTFNLSSSGVFSNREFGVIDRSASDAGTLAAIFDADWNRRAAHVSDANLAISPTTSRHDLQRLIDGARHTLDIYAEEVNDATVENHLRAAVQRHVRVRLITSQASAGVDAVRRDGVLVKLMPHPYVHAKAIVADGGGLFIGSENFSSTSLDRNREIGIITTNTGLAAVVEHTFSGDWSGSSTAGTSTAPPPPPSRPGGNLSVRVSASPGAVKRGQRLTISARTTPGARCRVRVTYPDGYVSRARSLAGEQVAGSDGAASWSWHVGSTSAGISTASVTCALSGRSGTGVASFRIIR